MPDVPTAPAAKACFDAVQERAPALWTALQDRLLPLAGDAARPADARIREVREQAETAWDAFREQDTAGEQWALGKSWPCCVEDVVAAVALDAAGAADRAELERVLDELQQAPPGTLSTARASMRVRSALAAAS
jgi:hypothetical protein